jgi:hypothetical protein
MTADAPGDDPDPVLTEISGTVHTVIGFEKE